MSETSLFCPGCGKAVTTGGASFCPFCGAPLTAQEQQPAEPEEVQMALLKYTTLEDPVKKGKFLEEYLAKYPDSLLLNEEKLFLGRLAHRDKRRVDFSLIKTYLLNLYLTPSEFSRDQKDNMRQEIFSHPDLERCLAIAPNREAYMTHYLERLCTEFVYLFLHSSSTYNHTFLGFRLDSRLSKNLAAPAAAIMKNIHGDTELTAENRMQLYMAFHRGFLNDVGSCVFLDQRLTELGLPVPARG